MTKTISNPNPHPEQPITGIRFDEKKQSYTVDYIKTIHGRRCHIHGSNFPTLVEAIEAKEKLTKARIEEENAKQGAKINLKSFFERYLQYRKRHVRDSSIKQAETTYHKYLKSYDNEKASSIFQIEYMMGIYESIIYDDQICPSWKNRIIGILRSMVSIAFRWKIILPETYQETLSMLENIPEDKRKVERPIWNASEEERFMSVIDHHDHYVMFSLFLELGARLGEFLGLTWDVYDGKKGKITICKQLLHGSQKTFELSDHLKTKESYRVCKLKKDTKEMLNEYKKMHPDTKYIFSSNQDHALPFSKAAFRKLFNHYIKLAKVKRITPHCIRHARATKMLKVCKNMLEVKAVARYMGHSATILLDVYSHSEDSVLEKVLKRLE